MANPSTTTNLSPAQELWRLIDGMDNDIDSVACCALLLGDFLEQMYGWPESDRQRINAHVMLTGNLLGIAQRLEEANARAHELATLLRADKAAA